MNNQTALSTIIETKASVGMSDMVDVFLTKYETDLYNKKSELKSIIKSIEAERTAFHKKVNKSFTWTKYKNLGIPELAITATLAEDHSIDWENAIVTMNVKVSVTKSKHNGFGYSSINCAVTQKISKTDINKDKRLLNDIEVRRNELTEIIMLITDMSRKERQIRGRISEKRLEEAGLTNFLQSDEMLQLIHID